MNRRTKSSIMLCLMMIVMLGLCHVSTVAGKEPEVPLTEQGEKRLAVYTDMLAALKAEIAASAPAMDEKKRADFLAAHGAVSTVPAPPNPNNLKNAPPRYADSNPPYKEAQAKALMAARSILAEVDTFLAGDKLHGQLAKCSLLVNATPRGLARFAQQGDAHEGLITALLADAVLMKQMLEMGGAYQGKYGRAMQIYTAVQKASERAREGFLQRLALGTALEHPDGNINKEGRTAADVMVAMYLNYEKAYLDGELDPAFDTYSDWEYRFIYPHRSSEDVAWFRQMLRNYRPDHIVMKDYKWRYIRIVKTDVPYTNNVKFHRGLGLTHMQEILLDGGICGPRAFMGKLATASFGIPTRGARQTGHAAMSHWTPDGWTTVLGAHWVHNRWRGRCGLDFLLETQARENPEGYRKVLRMQWLGDAFGEGPVHGMRYGTGGGLWHALAFYQKLMIVKDADMTELGPTGEELAESNVEAAPETIVQVAMTEADKTIVIGNDGVITMPVAACASPRSTEKIRFMKSIDGGIQLHYNLLGKHPELIRYTVNAPAAGQYELTARVVTVTMNRSFLLRLNRRTMVDIALPYTCGEWMDTKPVVIALKAGRNSLQFTSKPPNKGVTIKHFTLTPMAK